MIEATNLIILRQRSCRRGPSSQWQPPYMNHCRLPAQVEQTSADNHKTMTSHYHHQTGLSIWAIPSGLGPLDGKWAAWPN